MKLIKLEENNFVVVNDDKFHIGDTILVDKILFYLVGSKDFIGDNGITKKALENDYSNKALKVVASTELWPNTRLLNLSKIKNLVRKHKDDKFSKSELLSLVSQLDENSILSKQLILSKIENLRTFIPKTEWDIDVYTNDKLKLVWVIV